MPQLTWHPGTPPDSYRDRRLLLIAHPRGGTHDAAANNRPDLYVGHFNSSLDAFVPATGRGMNASVPRPRLTVLHWAEIDLPPGFELRELTDDDFKG
jgi:hypothetical protein